MVLVFAKSNKIAISKEGMQFWAIVLLCDHGTYIYHNRYNPLRPTWSPALSASVPGIQFFCTSMRKKTALHFCLYQLLKLSHMTTYQTFLVDDCMTDHPFIRVTPSVAYFITNPT